MVLLTSNGTHFLQKRALGITVLLYSTYLKLYKGNCGTPFVNVYQIKRGSTTLLNSMRLALTIVTKTLPSITTTS